ncbi:MAG: pseudouridine-5-phosphate glycosidase [Crocinitomicaceae bacterium]|nr:pseudouridine-5-phosphate glycosidase [Crocinitomicaceae bacterium]
MTKYLCVSDDVVESLKSGVPVVALESTIISHGMPYPQNLKCAKKLSQIIRSHGCTPAIIAVDKGKLHVGVKQNLLKKLASKDTPISKVSRRDIPIVLASGGTGATTVSGTLIACQLSGIKVFVTGGIGGVHRGAENTFDISADLEELALCDVAVVSAGVKSILDLEKTLEVLETKGVPVVGYGTDQLPAFYSRTSGLKLVARADTPEEVADIMKAKWTLGLRGSILVANPIPEEHEADVALINNAIDEGLAMANSKNIKGNELTPFILSYIGKSTLNLSLKSNLSLVENNARVGAQIARAYGA